MNGKTKPVTIDILVDGKCVGRKCWQHVPSKGDNIILANKKVVEVKRVVWAEVEGIDAIVYDCWVQLVCKYVKDVKVD